MGAGLMLAGSRRRSPAVRSAHNRPPAQFDADVDQPSPLRPLSTLQRDDVLALQRTAGNQAVQRMVGGGFLRIGSKGPDVKSLQEALIGAGASISADGAFGQKTRQAVVAYQQSAGLAADGVVGPKTWDALHAGIVKLAPSSRGGPAGPDPRMATLAALLGEIGKLVSKRAKAGGAGSQALAVEPVAREGWFDDAVDSVSDAASSATNWVEEKVDAAKDWVEDKIDAATDWAKDKAEGVVDAASGAAGAAASAAGPVASAAAAAVTQSAANVLGGPLKLLTDAAETALEGIPPLVSHLISAVEQAVASGGAISGVSSGAPVEELIDNAKKAIAELTGGDGEELSGGAGGASLDFKKSTGTAAEFTFDDETFGALRATLTARTTEIGRALPSVGTILFNGQDGTKLPGDEVVKSAKVSITENITLPVWSKENGPKVQDAQRQEWQRYRGAVAAHEDLHASDDQGIYGKAVGGLVGKSVTDAFAAIDAATEAGNKQGPVRDTANPAPILNPAGVEKV